MKWREVKLGDIVDRMTNGSSLDQYEIQNEGMLPITRIETIAFEEINFNRVKYVKATEDELEKYGLLHGDILFSHINSDKHLGKTAIHKTDKRIVHGINLLLIRTNSECDSFFLNYYFKYYRGLGKFVEIAQRAVNQSSINQKKLKEIKVILPPLPEQKRIVAKLDTLFTHLDQLKARLQNIPTLLKQFRQAVLTQAVTGKLTEEWRNNNIYSSTSELLDSIKEEHYTFWNNQKKSIRRLVFSSPLNSDGIIPSSWVYARSEDLTIPGRSITYGIIKPGPDFEGGVPYVRVTEMKTGKIDLDSLKKCSPDRANKFKKAELLSGDILISKDGTIGKVAIVPKELEGGNITQHVLRFSVSSKLINRYVAIVIQSQPFQESILNKVQGIGLQGINVNDFKELPIPVAPLEEQKEIVRRVESLFAVADRIEATYNTLQEKIDRLPQAILSKAFSGELSLDRQDSSKDLAIEV